MDSLLPGHPQHKRKGSALDLDACNASNGKARRPSEEAEERQLEEAALEEQQQEGQQEEAPALVLTERNNMHLIQLRESQDDLLKQIDDITAAGLGLLEHLKAGFLERMHTVKREVAALVDNAQESLCADSGRTIECLRRAAVAGDLIGKLSIKSRDEQQMRPSTLFSAEEEQGQEQQEEEPAAQE